MTLRTFALFFAVAWALAAVPVSAQQQGAPSPPPPQLRGYAGITVAQDISQEEAEKLGWKTPIGIRVTKLDTGGPADLAGFRVEDIIVSLDGQQFENPGALLAAIEAKNAGAQVRLGLLRYAQEHTVAVTLGVWPPSRDPILRIDPGMHAAAINRVGGDAACTLLATASDDATVRLWRLPKGELRGELKGELLRTLRPPIAGNEGKIRTVAVSPDGDWIAAGGRDAAYASLGGDFVYIFESATGAVLTRLGPVSNQILDIAVAANGRYLAASARGHGLLVWERVGTDPASWRLIAEDRDYGNQDIPDVAFDRTGVLFTVAFDGKLRRYAPNYQAKPTWIATRGGKQPRSIAVHPSGRQVAIGYEYLSAPVVEIYDAATLEWRYSADTRHLVKNNGELWAVAWSADGTRLYAGGSYPLNKRSSIFVWSKAGKGSAREVKGPWGSIFHLLPCGDGLAMGGAGPAFGLLAPDGRRRIWQENVLADLSITDAEPVAVSTDGTRVRFNLSRRHMLVGSEPVLFDLAAELLSDAPGPLADLHDPDNESHSVLEERRATKNNGDVKEETILRLGDKQPIEQDPYARDVAIAPDKESFILRKQEWLWSFDKNGKPLWRREGADHVWSVNITRDGKRFVAAYDDGTIRWHRLDDGQALLALVVHAKDRRWVAWTPKGYYMASPGGESLIGWHVNRSWGEAAQFFPADRFREQFNRPDIVKLVLETLDEGKAIEEANRRANRRRVKEDVRSILPPEVVIEKPADDSKFRAPEVTVEYRVFSPSGVKPTNVAVLFNGAAPRLPIAPLVDTGKFTFSGVAKLTLPPEDVTISVIAYEGDRASEPAHRHLRWDGAKPGELALPRLRALFVGVNEYTSLTKLRFAKKDATDLGDFFKAQEGKAYSKVETKVLTNPGRLDVLSGLQWLEMGDSTDDDVNLFFLAGHGMTDERLQFFYMAADSDPATARATGVSGGEILGTIRALRGHRVVMLDACHSGASTDAPPAGPGRADMNKIANEIGDRTYGIRVYASARGRQYSYERPEWGNGAFTKAMLDGLSGKADFMGRGYVETDALGTYVRNRVLDMTKKLQEPVHVNPGVEFTVARSRGSDAAERR